MKLDYKRVALVGFAFLLIQSFWQAYDAIVPLILVNKYGMNQTFSGVVMALDNALAVFMLPLFGAISDRYNSIHGRRTPFIFVGTILAVIFFITMSLVNNLWLFIFLLLLTLISMAIFRSPAVALMPDITVKPYRSKANAIINLMGTIGGITVLGLGALFKTGVKGKTDFTAYIIAVGAVMIIALIIFISTVKENKWSKEMQENTDKYFKDTEAEEREEVGGRLTRSQLKSLIFILASVALWYIGYNAVISKYSLYATNVLKQDYNTTLLIAQGAAIITYFPVGIIASKVGRKKSIIAGVVMLAIAFGSASFITAGSSKYIMYGLFSLAGIAWATINVNSFPMVVELAKGNDVGKYTGYYYTASMAAQIITPVLSGGIMDLVGNMSPLFPYATIFVTLAFITMLFVKHGDSKPISKGFLESIGEDN
jgi:MFS family permease